MVILPLRSILLDPHTEILLLTAWPIIKQSLEKHIYLNLFYAFCNGFKDLLSWLLQLLQHTSDTRGMTICSRSVSKGVVELGLDLRGPSSFPICGPWSPFEQAKDRRVSPYRPCMLSLTPTAECPVGLQSSSTPSSTHFPLVSKAGHGG